MSFFGEARLKPGAVAGPCRPTHLMDMFINWALGLQVSVLTYTKLHDFIMSTNLIELPLPLPEALRPWLVLNLEFHVIICHAAECQQAVNTAGISNHLSRKHHVPTKTQQELKRYLQQWQWQYNYRSVPLPLNRSLPQPVLPVIDGFQCKDCVFTTINRSGIRQHCNSEHGKKRLKDRELFKAVQLQTWFTAKRARYWVVDVDATRQTRDINISSGSGSGSSDGSDDNGAVIKAEVEEWLQKEKG
jgi:hypothetical protein